MGCKHWMLISACLVYQISDVLSQCQTIVNNTVTQTNFNINKFQGKWYEVYYIVKSFYGPQFMWDDVSTVYTVRADGTVSAGIHWRNPVTGKCNYLRAVLEQTGVDGRLKIAYTDWSPTFHDYWVLATDYTSYAVVYGCRQQDSQGGCTLPDMTDVLIWSRDARLSTSEMDIVRTSLDPLCIRIDNLRKTRFNQSCETVPELYPDSTCGAPGMMLHVALVLCLVLMTFLHTL